MAVVYPFCSVYMCSEFSCPPMGVGVQNHIVGGMCMCICVGSALLFDLGVHWMTCLCMCMCWVVTA